MNERMKNLKALDGATSKNDILYIFLVRPCISGPLSKIPTIIISYFSLTIFRLLPQMLAQQLAQQLQMPGWIRLQTNLKLRISRYKIRNRKTLDR